MYYVPGMLTLGIIVVRLIIKFSGGGSSSGPGAPAEYAITSELMVNKEVFDAVDLYPGKELLLVNKPETPEVIVKVKAGDDRFIELGVIENMELAGRVRQSRAKAKVLFTTASSVKVELAYS